MTPRTPQSKLLTRSALLERYGRPRSQRLVFTNGCFEILHRGHILYLNASRGLGDALVVGVNTDASARLLDKGRARPYVGEQDRALLVAALECVDAVCLFDEETPRSLIAELLPDVLVKGGDYRAEAVVGRAEVEAAGGRVVLEPLIAGYSTTDLLTRIRKDR